MRLLLTVVAVVLAGCVDDSGNTNHACRPLTPGPPTPPAAFPGTVFTVVMENHSASDIFGNPNAPYINQLVAQGAVAAGYHDSYVHPSEPNYIWMVAGENFGNLDDDDPNDETVIASRSHLADQIEAAGLSWRSYQESMGAPCGLSSHGAYAAKHDPFVFFDDINGWDGNVVHATPRCNEHVVDYSQLAADLAAGQLPKYVFITPNLDHDMHDGSIAQGDAWLSRELPPLLASEAFRNGGVLFLVWDEGGGLFASDDPPMIVVSPNVRSGYRSTVPYDESSFLKTVQEILGVETLPCNPAPGSVRAMDDLFTVPLSG
jgi:phosphatidylinositol-3-phosphatase